jgi:serine/threonine protein kinase/tetratricopeptide (TPR) repeat protein
MNDQLRREEAIFDGALSLPTESRGPFLEKSCNGDLNLRRRIEALLNSHDNTSGVLEHATRQAQIMAGFTGGPIPSEKPGDKIGRYKLLQQIGEGGCGVVYMAEQEEPVRRRVALKIIKLGMDTKQVIARFEAERQALAMMDHPNIAKVLDAGATEAGRPYFVMELVRGTKITDYSDKQSLSTRDRLELFLQVCQAIQHAHQKGIIHRDIKPSNILVTLQDGKPTPKVIDFGIAKATTGQRLTDQTLFTAFEQFLGTPAYMSPEQAELTSEDIDTRSDIYSLGVLLYELLTGKTPFDSKALLELGLDAMRRTIREQEPARPSTRLSTMVGADLSTTANRRHTEPLRLVSLVRGDLDWIVMKCLEKDRARRYETASGIAADLQRHLENEPVSARPPSRFYRLQKLVRRNKVVFGAAGAVAMALLLGLGTSTYLFVKEGRAREAAERAERAQGMAKANAKMEAARSQQVARFLQDTLGGIDPELAKGRDTALLCEVLDRTLARVDRELTNQPLVALQLQMTLARSYSAIGEFVKGEATARSALALCGSVLGKADPAYADALATLGGTLYRQGKNAEAEDLSRDALTIRARSFGSHHEKVAESMQLLGLVLQSRGRLVEAEDLFRKEYAIRGDLFGPRNVIVAQTLNAVAGVLILEGKLSDAENVSHEAFELYRQAGADDDLDLAYLQYNLANLFFEQGRLSEAGDLFRQCLDIRRKGLGRDHIECAVVLSGLASTLRRQGDFASAGPLYQECLAIREKRIPNAWYTFYTRTMLGASLLGQKRYVEAEQLLLSGYEGMKQRENDMRDRYRVFSETIRQLVQLYEAKGESEEAASWRKELAELDKSQTDGSTTSRSAWTSPAPK